MYVLAHLLTIDLINDLKSYAFNSRVTACHVYRKIKYIMHNIGDISEVIHIVSYHAYKMRFLISKSCYGMSISLPPYY